MPLLIRATSLPPILSHISPSSLAGLEQEVNETIHPQSMFWYPIDFVVYLGILWALALCLHEVILPSRFLLGSQWATSYDKHRRTMIVYLLSIVVTFIALVLQLSSTDVFHLQFKPHTLHMIRRAVTLITVLYLFEMIYREKMRFAMICHHCLTIFASGFMIVLLDKTQDASFILTGSLWLFQATTEQLTFIALFGYRMQWRPSILRPMLQFAALQSLLIKLTSVCACIVVWVKYQEKESVIPSYNRAWDVLFWFAAFGLMVTQFWGSWVVWVMGSSLEARYAEKNHKDVAANCHQVLVVEGNAIHIQQPATLIASEKADNTSVEDFVDCLPHLHLDDHYHHSNHHSGKSSPATIYALDKRTSMA